MAGLQHIPHVEGALDGTVTVLLGVVVPGAQERHRTGRKRPAVRSGVNAADKLVCRLPAPLGAVGRR
ncbi:hypothetical protein GCM10025789_30600 [Tessaracoccus lubricantis]|uniref:Uncharacterized protein n=1 Tax=Tessaracoccus lubricantis TaxID=545543 RepID=A0ABP9FP28_9ACTN